MRVAPTLLVLGLLASRAAAQAPDPSIHAGGQAHDSATAGCPLMSAWHAAHDSTHAMTMPAGHSMQADMQAAHGGACADTSFAAMQARGRGAMGVDQYTSTHRFDSLPDGGRIELQRDRVDEQGTAVIRAHLREIAAAFAGGDFATPALVHGEAVPGSAVMAARHDQIRYEVHDLPRGAELRITTSDAEALLAIHQFMAYQRAEHHAGGAEHE